MLSRMMSKKKRDLRYKTSHVYYKSYAVTKQGKCHPMPDIEHSGGMMPPNALSKIYTIHTGMDGKSDAYNFSEGLSLS